VSSLAAESGPSDQFLHSKLAKNRRKCRVPTCRGAITLKRAWRTVGTISLSILFLASFSIAKLISNFSQAQNGPVSLFGIQIGTPLPDSREYVFVQEDESTLHYILRNTTNPEYLIQGVNISKRSRVVTSVDGRTPTGPVNGCQRMLSETITQLSGRYPALQERVDDAAGTQWHLLSMNRLGCFLNVQVERTSLRVPCSSSFLLHCEHLSNAFVIEASDTEFSDLAKQEAGAVARTPKRNHLD
jgi:hypothetical protein